MEMCSLYPPNSSSLSSDVIGSVVQHVQPHRATNSVSKPDMNIRHSRQARPPTVNENTMSKKQKETLELLLARQDRRREVCRVNQARYVQRQRKFMTDLEGCIRRLRNEVKDLGTRRTSASISIPKQKTAWNVATEYFRLFRHGSGSPQELDAFALKFLQTTMATDITNGSLCGPAAILNNWKLFSLYFADIEVELEKLVRGEAATTLVATTTTSVTISNDTLRRVFPHQNSDGKGGANGGEWSPLAERLRGQRLVMRGSVWFYWDKTTAKVARMETQSDMLTPMLRVLGSLQDVSRAFEHALVTPECRLIGAQSVNFC